MYETSHQSRFDARYWMLGAGALGRPRGEGMGREEVSGWGTQVYLADSFRYLAKLIHIIKFKNKIKKKNKQEWDLERW